MNTPITIANEHDFVTSAVTTDDMWCYNQWEVTLFTGDANTNLVMDISEFSAVIPTTGSVGTHLFYKSSAIDTTLSVNYLKPLLNSDSEIYHLKVRHFFDHGTVE
jgi:hypothetical protein